MAEKEINITYETLFDLLRREKNREELQRLSDSFFDDINSYMNEKLAILREQQTKIGISSKPEKEKTSKQIENIKSMIKGLFERRQQKIVQMAISKSRTSNNPGDYEALLGDEKELFDELVEILNKFKGKTFLSLVSSEKEKFKEPDIEKEREEDKDNEKRDDDLQSKESNLEEKKESEKTRLIRFLNPVPRFLGENLEVYGPFEEDDTSNLPENIAEILIMKGRAEEIKK